VSGFRHSKTIEGTKAAAETVSDRFSGGDFGLAGSTPAATLRDDLAADLDARRRA
jgi:hypothetical protein